MNLRKLKEQVDQKFISVQKHPTEDLWIYNYTPKAQFEKHWTPETMAARGLILDAKGNIVARPFKKFFNLGEYQDQIPNEPFEVTEKMDGSLGILYYILGATPQIATRGSFTSEQALRGTEILHRLLQTKSQHGFLIFDPEWTWLFEILYPQNRIVVDYGNTEDLVLIGCINTRTGEETPVSIIDTPFTKVKTYDGITDINKLKDLEEENREGFVIRFPKSNLRLKVKFEEYVRLHKILTGVNARRIWEILKEGGDMQEVCYAVPDEFMEWVQKTSEKIKTEYREIEIKALTVFGDLMDKALEDRKLNAMEILKYPDIRSLLFAMLDGKDYRSIIWDMIKPEHEKPFRKEYDA